MLPTQTPTQQEKGTSPCAIKVKVVAIKKGRTKTFRNDTAHTDTSFPKKKNLKVEKLYDFGLLSHSRSFFFLPKVEEAGDIGSLRF